jgi:hypothetical protein
MAVSVSSIAAIPTSDKEPKFQALSRLIFGRIIQENYSMFYERIVTSNAPVTSVNVDGRPHHYFHSEKLGKCRALVISEDVNLGHAPGPYATKPLGKGEQLESLMDCGERLHKRYWSLWIEYDALPESDNKGRKALLAKMDMVNDASIRVSRKIGLLFSESR